MLPIGFLLPWLRFLMAFGLPVWIAGFFALAPHGGRHVECDFKSAPRTGGLANGHSIRSVRRERVEPSGGSCEGGPRTRFQSVRSHGEIRRGSCIRARAWFARGRAGTRVTGAGTDLSGLSRRLESSGETDWNVAVSRSNWNRQDAISRGGSRGAVWQPQRVHPRRLRGISASARDIEADR